MNSTLSTSPLFLPDDGLAVTAAEPWFTQKINLLHSLLSAFVANVSGRVTDIVFVDLYAGNGMYSLGARKDRFPDSSITVLKMDLPVTKYVFCERDEAQARILKVRVNKYFRDKNVALITGKSEELLEKLKMYVPAPSKGYKVAVFCYCDPFSLDAGVQTLGRLCELGFTVLTPITLPIGKMVDYRFYVQEERMKLSKYFEDYEEVRSIEKDLNNNLQFYRRLVNKLNQKLMLKGINSTLTMHKLDSGLMDLPYYYSGLFSSRMSTAALQNDAVVGMTHQFDLFES